MDLANLPDTASVTLTVAELRRLLSEARTADGPEFVSTEQAAALLGKSPEWWQDAARAGRIPGAWQDGDRAPWNLPLAACREHIAALQRRRDIRRGARRGPWKIDRQAS